MGDRLGDRLGDVFERLLNAFLGRNAVKAIDACAFYPGFVVKQTSDGRKVDVVLDVDPLLIPSPSNVPLLNGMPGVTAKVTAGKTAYVLVGFWNGDLSQPYALGAWIGNETCTSLDIEAQAVTINSSGAAAAVRVGDDLTASSAFKTWAAAVDSGIATNTPPPTPFATTAGLPGGMGVTHGGSPTVKIG